MQDLEGHIALVTGCTTGIGEAISSLLQAMGARVAATYCHDRERAEAFTARTGIRAYGFSVTDHEACAKAVDTISGDLGPVDVLINNAGITSDSSLAKLTPQNWARVIDTNLTGAYNMCHAAFPGMRERRFGRIVNISSINGEAGQFGQTNYAASKAGLLGFTRALALEGASCGVTVNAVAPGYTETDMMRAVPTRILERILTQIPVGRFARAEEVARCVAFLCSPDAGFITGATIDVNGGQYMR